MVLRASAALFALVTTSAALASSAAPSADPDAPAKYDVASKPKAPEKPDPGAQKKDEAPPPPEPPPHDPLLVRKAIDVSAEEPPDGRARLGLRLSVVPGNSAEPWLLAVVNRGTEPARVLFDLRLISLEITPPPVESAAKRKPKPVKPVVCRLPANVRPDMPRPELEVRLAPGEGIVDAFDPRLYCFSAKHQSLLAGGAQVSVHFGFAEKTKAVWKKGKPETLVVEQSPPFVARRATPIPDLTEIRQEQIRDPGPGAPRSDIDAIKELIAPAIEIAPEVAMARTQPPGPFELLAVEGSDAKTARGVTVTVSTVNRSPEAKYVYFRRELLSFDVSGPNGIVSCEPGPDVRAPDRQSFSRLKPGGRISASSRLIELCPDGTFDEPGLYLVDTSFDATRSGGEYELDAFTGHLESAEPVAVRVQEGPKPLSPRHASLMVKVGAP